MCLPVTYNNKSVKMLPETVNVGIPPEDLFLLPKALPMCKCSCLSHPSGSSACFNAFFMDSPPVMIALLFYARGFTGFYKIVYK